MAAYGAGEARDWAREHLRGVAGCLAPTMRADLSGLNERAVRHDITLARAHGYSGLLIVAEAGTSRDELRRLCELVVDEGRGLFTIVQASEGTLAANLELVRDADAAGVDLVLPSFPLGFYPTDLQTIYDYVEALATCSRLGVILFAAHLWNFARLHSSGFAPALIDRIVTSCPNVVAIKNEVGQPGVSGIAEVFERFADRVVVTDPLEMNAPAWVKAYGMQFLGTSNYEYLGPTIPRVFALLHDPGGYDAAMDLFWKVHPARKANLAVMGEAVAGTALVPRMLWKYQSWLTGYNGGPLRPPQGRISDAQMRTLRTAIGLAGMSPPMEGDELFFVGRNPE